MTAKTPKKKKSEKSIVRFASTEVRELRRDATLPAKFERVLQTYPFEEMFKDRSVAIKMHFGGDLGYTTIHPLFVRILVQKVKDAGGRPFITDGSGAMKFAVARGYTEEVLGAPLVEAAGVANKYAYTREVGFEQLDTVDLCGNIVDADAMIVFSHGKGHGHCGFGGAIKNLAMGCVANDSRGKIHRLQGEEFLWESEKCTRCKSCVDNCPAYGALYFDDEENLKWSDHNCRYCRHCDLACPEHAIHLSTEGFYNFQKGMALVTQKVIESFAPGKVLFLNVLMNITPYCDCWGFSTPSLVPDIGIIGSTDVAAIEEASLDLIKEENFIPGALPLPMKLGEGKHLFEQIHGKDPYLQVVCAEEIGLGSRAYTLEEIA
jgi:uncharacterized protein